MRLHKTVWLKALHLKHIIGKYSSEMYRLWYRHEMSCHMCKTRLYDHFMMTHFLCLVVCQAFKVYQYIFKRDRRWDDFSHQYSLMLGDITRFFRTTMPVCISRLLQFLLTSYLGALRETQHRYSISLLISLFWAVRCHTVSATPKSGWAMNSITFHTQDICREGRCLSTPLSFSMHPCQDI